MIHVFYQESPLPLNQYVIAEKHKNNEKKKKKKEKRKEKERNKILT
jgi:hypothetical protein